MGQIELKGIRKSFGGVDVIKGIDLQINEGELVIFVGPSGCGKSTLLRLISGLVEASDGQILIDGDDVTGKPPAERELSMVFQSYALYPHKSVRENMGFALTVAGMPKAEITQKVDEAAATLKLEDYLDRKPKALSGGQRQRVAIGRAIVREPKAFLFDEPLSNLDAALRVEMRLEIARLHQKLGATMVYVTHDQVEAMTLADKIVVLQAGQIEQIGSPLDLYRHPGNLFVAQFIGSPKMNVVDCTGTGTSLTFGNGNTSDIARNTDGATKMGIRPEHMALCDANDTSNTTKAILTGQIDVMEHLGSDSFAYVNVPDVGLFTVRIVGHSDAVEGDTVGLHFASRDVHLFDASEKTIPA
ncbi:ABC transporter ATP-binding protein [Thalassospira sp. HJ]|uniref:ABC transporter ATP-binding protein n=1 Tax=Thalassospira sp. HJ TaxID=1616823 RepID=UPI0005CF2F71|nr:sn-glycerol-3-phosphate ABC transporter ATP-binding protein UgpC [Thalassospira sp. HJ]KJE36604.1 ABC transporter ATP-binding protein [Thalassospira sp. HJ]